MSKYMGKVFLVGAGPGDAELLTIRALKSMQSADLILFDYLVSEDIRALFPPSVPAFYVGKKMGAHSIAQEDLNSLMVKKAKAGKTICRIKGGDPFIFGRGGEEALALIDEGIEVEVIPGITAASGCGSYSGIPLTHRGIAQGCTFVTGHGESQLNIQWDALAKLNHTLVFYMGLNNAPMIRDQLTQNGLDASTPCAVIENGCRENQRVFKSNLGLLPEKIKAEALSSPALIIVGEVVSLSEILNVSPLKKIMAQEEQRLSA